VGFRFGFALAVLFIYPFPIGFLPKTEKLGDWLNKPFEWLTIWVTEHVLGAPTPSTAPTGSGDTMFLWVQIGVLLALAAVAAVIWSLADRRRTAYPRLAAWTVIALRYWLAVSLLSYGMIKVLPSQFGVPNAIRLDERIGDISPMGMLWTFMGSSMTYTRFAGALEMLGGALLLSHRLRVLGAAIAAGVMLNVVMLNFCYDVPVKLFSLELLIIAVILLAPHVRRLLAAFIAEARERGKAGHERGRFVIKIAMVCVIAYNVGTDGCDSHDLTTGTTPLDGAWHVDRFVLDGVERPPLETDATRWNKLLFAGWPSSHLAIARLAGRGERKSATVVEFAHVIVTDDATWRYAQPDPDHLVIDAPKIHATLSREPAPLLTSRGFHWVQESPYNR
jgi:hypothetical protein